MDDGVDTGQADDDDERATELDSVSAIYPEIVVDPKSPYAASLDLAVTPLTPIKIRFQPSADGNAPQLPTPPTSTEQVDSLATRLQILPAEAAVDEHDLAHLPSLIIHITLPEQYPANAPPTVQLSCIPPWIPPKILKTLEDDCEKLWEEWGRAEVVYTYIDHLSQAAENAFGVSAQGFQLSSDMKLVLLDFDLKTKRELFDKETFDCGICLEPKKGSICHRLMLCGHVFCVACLQDFYNNCITEGDIDSVKCLDPGCNGIGTAGPATPKRRKQDRTINPSELLQIPIEQELVQRYVRMKRKRKLEADKNTIYCPRQWCQGAARSKKHPKPADPMNDLADSASDSEAGAVGESSATPKKKEPEYVPMSERLSICEDCSFAFCSVCKKGWHGEMAVCNPRRDNEMNEEERASLAYLQRYSTPCPTCSAPAQKTMGCNHMICHVCKTHYCYLCSAYLMPDNPYRHYNEDKSTCYMRLWELEGGDGADVGYAYEGGNADWEAEPSTDGENDELEEENLADFAGDEPLIHFADDEDSDDEEPAPDQRRPGRDGPMQIELVNAAGHHIIHNIPERPRPAIPAAPVPPPAARPGRRRRGGPQHPPNHGVPRNQGRPPPAPANIRQLLALLPNLPNAPGPGLQQNNLRAVDGRVMRGPLGPLVGDDADEGEADAPRMVQVAAAPGQGNAVAQGLERFLQLAHNDQEDEWDSDELDDDLEIEPRAWMRQNGRRQ